MAPFLALGGVFVLVRTSNPSAAASTALNRTQKSRARPHRKTRSTPRAFTFSPDWYCGNPVTASMPSVTRFLMIWP